MLLKHKITLVIVFPLLLLMAYQFYSIDHVFDVIKEVRSQIFVESAKEVKYANDVQFLTSLMSSTLFELENAHDARAAESFDRTVRLYRETQMQRYFALQKLKETLTEESGQSFQFIQILDQNKLSIVNSIEEKIKRLDAHNEKIISIIVLSTGDDEAANERYEYIQNSNELTREIVGNLAEFTNQRYIKVEETSKLVASSENDARNTLLLICAVGYLLATLIIVFFYTLIILPLERFARALDKGTTDNIAWTSLEPFREDEIGQLYRALENCLVHHTEKKKPEKKVRAAKRKKSIKKEA